MVIIMKPSSHMMRLVLAIQLFLALTAGLLLRHSHPPRHQRSVPHATASESKLINSLVTNLVENVAKTVKESNNSITISGLQRATVLGLHFHAIHTSKVLSMLYCHVNTTYQT